MGLGMDTRKNMCSDEIGLCVQNMTTMNDWGIGLYDHLLIKQIFISIKLQAYESATIVVCHYNKIFNLSLSYICIICSDVG
jgi:hypothetical protein